jgi:methyl-accepting chemotaxis protein
MKQLVKDMSLRTKLFTSFGAVIALSVILGVVLIVEMSSVNSGGISIATNALPSTRTIDDVEFQEANYRADQLWNITNTVPANAVIAIAALDKARATVAADFKTYAGLVANAHDAALLSQAQSQWNNYVTSSTGLNGVKDTTKQPKTVALANSSDTVYRALATTLTQWQALNTSLASAKISSNKSTYSSARLIGIILLLLVAIIGVSVAWVLSSAVKGTVDTVLERLRSLQENCIVYLRDGLQAFSNADLTQRYFPVTALIEAPGNDEIGQVAQATNIIRNRVVEALEAYNETAVRLSGVIGQVSGSAGELSAASQQMASTSEESGRATGEIAQAVSGIAQGAERQVQMVEEARRAAEEVGRAVTEAATAAQETAELAHSARGLAQDGVASAEKANDAMRAVRDSSQEVSDTITELAAKSEQIGEIVQTITGIAGQTNLLALNAAIEAARAGEQGRGFAVVAEEVRKLAEDSQRAAHEISTLVHVIQTDTSRAVEVVQDGAERTQEGTVVVEQTREAFMRIGQAVDDMTARVEQVAAVSEEIAASAETVQVTISGVAAVAEESSAATEQASASTEQTSASAQEIAASAQQLSANAETLNQLVSQFKVEAGSATGSPFKVEAGSATGSPFKVEADTAVHYR